MPAALLTLVVGFGFSGWQMQSNAERTAEKRVDAAVVAALTPICVEKFNGAANVKATQVALNATNSWRRDGFVEKGGSATFPATGSPTAASPKLAPRFSARQVAAASTSP